jgi:histidinol-phosphate aminotransferase
MNLKNILPENIKMLKPYAAGKTIAEVKKLYKPKRISKLASNENRLGCSPLVQQAVMDSLSDVQDYPDPLSGRLRKKIAVLSGVDENEVLIAAGSESLISIICRTFFKNDEHAITANATFVGFFVQAGVRGVSVKKIPITNDYKFDVDSILDSISSKTKMVYIANPNNPTGTYLNKEEYRRLVEGLPEDVLLIADEAYFEFAESLEDYPKALDYRYENVIVLRTFSKAYGLAGFRIGYAIADERLILEMIKTKLTFEPTTPAQAAALAALDDTDFIKKSVQTVADGRERLYSFFREYGVKFAPSISNSVMMILDSEEEANYITENMLKQGVILRRVNAFGLPNCIRITIGTPEEMAHFEESFMNVAELKKV